MTSYNVTSMPFKNCLMNNKLTLNAQKSVSFDFNNKNSSRCCIELNGESLRSQARCIYLGLFVDKLNFADQIQKVKISLSRQCGLVSEIRYFIPLSVLLKYYAYKIKPIIQYGSLVFACTSKILMQFYCFKRKLCGSIFYKNISDNVSQLFSDKEILTVYELYLYDLLKFCFRVANKIRGHEIFRHYFLILLHVSVGAHQKLFLKHPFKSKLKLCSMKYGGIKLLNIFAENNLRKKIG